MTENRYELINGRVFFRGRCFAVEFKTKDEAREAAVQVGLKPGHYVLKAICQILERPTKWSIVTIEAAMQEVHGKSL